MPFKDPGKRRAYEREYWAARPEQRKAKGHRAYMANRDEINAKTRKWAEAHPEIARASRRVSEERYRDKRREKARLYAKRRNAANPEENRRKWEEWRAQNPARAALSKRQAGERRRARELRAFIEDVDPIIVYEMHGGRCGICGEFISGDFHVDHVIPLSRGGKHGYINVQPAHPACNMSKGAKLPEEMAA